MAAGVEATSTPAVGVGSAAAVGVGVGTTSVGTAVAGGVVWTGGWVAGASELGDAADACGVDA